MTQQLNITSLKKVNFIFPPEYDFIWELIFLTSCVGHSCLTIIAVCLLLKSIKGKRIGEAIVVMHPEQPWLKDVKLSRKESKGDEK